MFNQESRDQCLTILTPGFPPLLIPIAYEVSYWQDSGYFIFLLDNDRIEGLLSRLPYQKRMTIQFPPYLSRLILRNLIALSGLVLVTYYQQMSQEKAIAATSISLDGDVSQQILKDCLEYPRLQDSLTCHWWLVRHILGVFYSKIRHWLRWCNHIFLAGGTFCGGLSIIQGLGFQQDNFVIILLALIILIIIMVGIIVLQIRYPQYLSARVSQIALVLGMISSPGIQQTIINYLLVLIMGLLNLLMANLKVPNNNRYVQKILALLNNYWIVLLEVLGESLLLMSLIFYFRWVRQNPHPLMFALTMLTVLCVFRLRDRLPVLLKQWLWQKILRTLVI